MAKKRTRRRRRLPGGNALWIAGAGFLVVVAAVAVALAVRGGDSPPARRQLRQTPVVSTEMQATVEIVDNDYKPRNLTVPVGATVTWVNTGKSVHTVSDDRKQFDSKSMSKGAEFVQTFDKAGTFYYYCIVHHAMLGTLIVGG